MLRGSCRYCKAPISILYPFIEILTSILLTALVLSVSTTFLFGYFFFFSALIVTIRSDLETMLISRFVTLFLVPIGFLLSWLHVIPLSFQESILGAFSGFIFLFLIAKLFTFFTGKHGMGQGDIDLIAFIGSFIGISGCWVTLFIGSFMGSIVGIIYIITAKPGPSAKIPFGPFLALGAMSYVLLQKPIIEMMLKLHTS